MQTPYTEQQKQDFKEQFERRGWRYPACNKYLGRDVSTRFSKSCGVELRS